METLSKIFILILVLIAQNSTAQQAIGGGQTIGGQLADVFQAGPNSTVCNFQPLELILNKNPNFNNFLSALALKNAYLPTAYRAESRRIQVCLGGPLHPLERIQRNNINFKNKIFKRLNQNLETVAYRSGSYIYVDTKKIAAVAAQNSMHETYFWTHEITHSFILDQENLDIESIMARYAVNDSDPKAVSYYSEESISLPKRDRVWSFVATLIRIHQGDPNVDLASSIRGNGVSLPDSDVFYKKTPIQYETALDRNSAKSARLSAIAALDWNDVEVYLVPGDQAELAYYLENYYHIAFELLQTRPSGWLEVLKTEMASDLDPFQVVPGRGVLMDAALEIGNNLAVEILFGAGTLQNNSAAKQNLVKAIIENRLQVKNIADYLANVDPNLPMLVYTHTNGKRKLVQESSLFSYAIHESALDVVDYFLMNGKVNLATANIAISEIVVSKNISNKRWSRIFTQILSIPGLVISDENFLAAYIMGQSYAFDLFLTKSAPTGFLLIEIAKVKAVPTTERLTIWSKVLSVPGININVRDSSGLSALDYAVLNQDADFAKVLIMQNPIVTIIPESTEAIVWFIHRIIDVDSVPVLEKTLALIEQNNFAINDFSFYANLRLSTNTETYLNGLLK